MIYSAATAVTVEEIQAHIHKLFSQVRIHGLIVGNMYKDVRVLTNPHELRTGTLLQEAIRLVETAEHAIGSSALPEPVDERALIPPHGRSLAIQCFTSLNIRRRRICLAYGRSKP